MSVPWCSLAHSGSLQQVHVELIPFPASKSANYCNASISNGHALLLLCESELGTPMHTLTNASYTAGEDAKANGALST